MKINIDQSEIKSMDFTKTKENIKNIRRMLFVLSNHKKELMKQFHEQKSYQQQQLQDETKYINKSPAPTYHKRLRQTIKNLKLKQTLLQIRATAPPEKSNRSTNIRMEEGDEDLEAFQI